MGQPEPKKEAPQSDWELVSLHTFPVGGGWMVERVTSSTSEETRLTVQYDLGSGLGVRQVFQHTWCHTFSDTPEQPSS